MQEPALVEAAELVWQVFAAGSSTAAAAERMLQNVKSSPLGSGSCLGRTAWNAYSLNINYRTGMRVVTVVHWFDGSCFVIIMHACLCMSHVLCISRCAFGTNLPPLHVQGLHWSAAVAIQAGALCYGYKCLRVSAVTQSHVSRCSGKTLYSVSILNKSV